jgi:hypothetical protein
MSMSDERPLTKLSLLAKNWTKPPTDGCGKSRSRSSGIEAPINVVPARCVATEGRRQHYPDNVVGYQNSEVVIGAYLDPENVDEIAQLWAFCFSASRLL